MDWARDQFGNDIPASQGGISSWGLVCPSCGEPVYRRAGKERQPHYAHYSQRAKPECENYFPTAGHQPSQHSAVGADTQSKLTDRRSLNCGLFLGAPASTRGVQLWLRIPPFVLDQELTGELRIHSGLGLRTYSAADLNLARLIPLRPQSPLANCVGSGELSALSTRLRAELNAFQVDRNLFYADERGGRLVLQNEPLEWGTRYRLLANTALEPSQALQNLLSWQVCPMLDEWHLYELSMPPTFAASDMTPEKVSEFLGKKIRRARPRLFIVAPPPHHIDTDGTYVYPEDPPTILIRRSVPKRLDIFGLLTSPELSEVSDEWVKIEKISTRGVECVVSIDGDEQAIFRVEPCELFMPSAVVAHCSSQSWELTSAVPIDDAELRRFDINVECPSERVAAHIA